MNNLNSELPLTALCVVSDRSKCPPNYSPIFKSYDTNTETDLWKDGLFGKKINRFICFTKDYPIAETYNVIEDIKLLNERENLGGFIPVDKCLDTSEKAFQKKVLCIKVSHRFYTPTAVSDIIILVKSKRAPNGYSYIGEVNGNSICIKFSQIPNNTTSSSNLNPYRQTVPPPIPPRPFPTQQTNQNDPYSSIEQSYVHVRSPIASPSNGFNNNLIQNELNNNLNRSLQSVHSTNTGYNPLHGVPFEINPIYDLGKSNSFHNELIETERINRKLMLFNQTLEKFDYDFNLERSCLASI